MRHAPSIGTLVIAVTAGAAIAAAPAFGQTYYPPPTPPPPPPTVTPPPPAPLFTAKLALARASTAGGVLDVLLPITSRASGHVNVEYHAAARRNRFTAPIDSDDARVRFRRKLPAAQARLGTGILTIAYPGDADTRPQSVRLRAARRPAELDLERPRIVNDRIQAAGSITNLARGVVRLQLEYQVGPLARVERFRGTIVNGRWSIDEPLSAQTRAEIALRTGTLHSYTQFTGYFPRRVRGEMRSYEVLGRR